MSWYSERGLRGGEIELPHPAEALVIDAGDLGAVREEALAPGLQRLGVVEPQDLDVGRLQPDLVDHRQHLRHRRDVAAGEDVLLDPGVGVARAVEAADRVEHHDAVRREQVAAGVEKGAVVADADMLEHADRDDAVERPVDLAIVAEKKAHAVGEAALARARRFDTANCSSDSVTPVTSAPQRSAR